MGQTQQKAAAYLNSGGDGAGQVAEAPVMYDEMQQGCEDCRKAVGLEQGLELLLDAFADGPLAEAVAAGNVKRCHQGFPKDEGEKGGERQPAAGLQRIIFGSVCQHDGKHTGTFEHVEHANGIYGAGLGSLHEKGSFPCAVSDRKNVLRWRRW